MAQQSGPGHFEYLGAVPKTALTDRMGCLKGDDRGRTGGPTPAYVRFDHGPEFIAYAVSDLCRFSGTDTVFIDPGSPWQNAWIESFNGRLRYEFLNGQQFVPLLEAQVLLEGLAHRLQHQQATQRARLAQEPAEFVESWLSKHQLTLA